MSTEKVKWLVVYVASRKEKSTLRHLQKLGVDCYLPVVNRLQQWSDRKKWVEFPMFTGYLFVRPDATERDAVLELPGVVCYLQFNKSDAVVRNKEIEILKQIEVSGYYSESIHTPEDYNLGEKLIVLEGPLKGNQVILIRKSNEFNFLVSIEALGQSVKLNLPYEILSKVK
jgi:transcription antitermination factor NusG